MLLLSMYSLRILLAVAIVCPRNQHPCLRALVSV